jgi:hypothetical protein
VRDPAAVEAFFLFLQGAGSQRAARFCERGIPGYRERFDAVFTRWAAQHRSRIERGEAMFYEALAEKDRPNTDHAKLQDMAKAIAELKEPPRDTSPIAADDGMRRTCEAVITDLEVPLTQ